MNNKSDKTRAGSCQCGNVRYEILGPDSGLSVCYCSECRKMSTGYATYSLIVPRASFRINAGSLKQWERTADSGARNVCHFCPECGVRIYHENPDMDFVRVKAGTLDDARHLVPDAHVWTRSAPDWIQLPPGCLAYETQGKFDELLEAIRQRRVQGNSWTGGSLPR